MQWHPAAEAFPMMSDEEIADLAADIKERGLLSPIVVLPDGTGLDGRNRWAASLLAGVEPTTVTYEGDDPLGFVVASNLRRRQMTHTARVFTAARALPVYEAEALRRKQAGTLRLNQGEGRAPTSVDRAAKDFDVGQDSVQQVKALLAESPLDLAVKAETGDKRISQAYDDLRKERTRRDREVAEAARAKEYQDAIDAGQMTLKEALAKVVEDDVVAKERQERLEAWAAKVVGALSVLGRLVGPPVPEELLAVLGDAETKALELTLAALEGADLVFVAG